MGTEISVNPHGESIPNLKNPEKQFSTYAQRIGCNKKSMRPRKKNFTS